MFPDQYSSMPYFSRPPVFTYTNPPRSFHRQPPSPPGGSPGTSSGQLADSPPPVKSDYDDAREYSLLHPSDQSAGYPHAMHGVSEMGGGMGYAPGSLDLSFPSDMLTVHHHQQYMPTVPPMQHAYPTGAFPVMAPLGQALDDPYERYSPSDHGSSDSGSSNTIPSDYETEKYLRDHLRISEPAPLNLDAIADDKAKISTLIILSIWASPGKRLTLKGIYDAIEARFPQRKAANDKPWQRSIRHNLSLKAMFVYEERPTSHPGKGRYWKIDVSKGTGNKRNRKRKLGGRKDGDDFGEDEEDAYEDDDEEEASSRDQARRQYGAQSLHRLENNAGTPVFTYPDGTSFDSSRGLTQSPPMALSGGQHMNYLMALDASYPSQVDNFHPSSTPFRGPFPNMNSAEFGARTTMKSFPSAAGPTYLSVPPPGPSRAMSLPPQPHVYHPAPHVEIPRRHTTSAAVGRHQHQYSYGGSGMMSHPPIPDGALMQQGSSQSPQNHSLRAPSDLSPPNAGSQETSRKRRLR